ncbi:hypothetical protein THAOC_04027, partial [Thalassiosira oceanica]
MDDSRGRNRHAGPPPPSSPRTAPERPPVPLVGRVDPRRGRRPERRPGLPQGGVRTAPDAPAWPVVGEGRRARRDGRGRPSQPPPRPGRDAVRVGGGRPPPLRTLVRLRRGVPLGGHGRHPPADITGVVEAGLRPGPGVRARPDRGTRGADRPGEEPARRRGRGRNDAASSSSPPPPPPSDADGPYSVESIFSASIARWQSVLGLEKPSFLRRGVLFPPTAVPDRGPNGHMALMDCVFNALSTTPPDPGVLMEDAVSAAAAIAARSGSEGGRSGSGRGFGRSGSDDRLSRVMAAGRGRQRVLLADLIIVFAVARLGRQEMLYRGLLEERRAESERRQAETERHLAELERRTDGTAGDESGEGSAGEEMTSGSEHYEDAVESASGLGESPAPEDGGRHPGHDVAPPPRSDGLALLSRLAFRVYDGYQRQNTLTRDTLQRFLSDIHGEESYKAPAGRRQQRRGRHEDRRRGRPEAPEQPPPDAFVRGIHTTLAYVDNPAAVRDPAQPSAVASHVLLDWMVCLLNAMLPRSLPPPQKVAGT